MENQVNTITEDKTPEQIEAEMFQTRESLTEKVAALENQVVGTVQSAANTLTDTVDAVKSFVNTAPEAVSETVENVVTAVREQVERTFDITAHVRKNPWTSVGASLGLGFLAGYLFFPKQPSSTSSLRESAAPETFIPPETPRGVTAPREPGFLDELFGIMGKKAREMAERAIDVAAVAASKNIQENVPKLIDEAARRFVPQNSEPVEQPFETNNLKTNNHVYSSSVS